MCALSAFEMALWDISGKIQDKSLSSLFVESNKSSIQIYANTWSDVKFNNHDVLNNAISQIDENFASPGFEIHSGEAILLDRPGLGVIIDEKELRKLTHKYLFSNI
jgi:L-alanine-DL-glutamate epimerase-like enolase superfamily enzyme